MTKLGELVFKAEDFRPSTCYRTPVEIAERANAILRAKLEKAPEVFGHGIPGYWCQDLRGERAKNDTHRARLVCIEPIAGEKG